MKSFEAYRATFAELYTSVKHAHKQSSNQHYGHGFDHDTAVAQMAALIAPSEKIAKMGWVAGIIHSTDHIVKESECAATLRDFLAKLPAELCTQDEIEEIYLAALEHAEKIPAHRSPTQEVVQDADKLVNMQAALLIRVGQFRPGTPALELTYLDTINPESTYHAPKSVFDNIRIVAAEYPPLLHTEKGKKLASIYAQRLQAYERHILEDYQLLGLAGVIL